MKIGIFNFIFLVTVLFFMSVLFAKEKVGPSEEEIKNTQEYFYEESYTDSEERSLQEAKDALVNRIMRNQDGIELKNIVKNIGFLVIKNGLGVQAIAYLSKYDYQAAIAAVINSTEAHKKLLPDIPESCSLKIGINSFGSKSLHKKMSEYGTRFLTNINTAFKSKVNRTEKINRIDLDNISINKNAKKSINGLWLAHPFVCTKRILYGPIIKTPSGNYRFDSSIPLYFANQEKRNAYQQASIEFDDKGTIETFYINFKEKGDTALFATPKITLQKHETGQSTQTIVKGKSRILTIPAKCTLNIAKYSMMHNSIRNRMNKNTSLLLNEINRAYKQADNSGELRKLVFKSIKISKKAKNALRDLWKMSPFAITKSRLSGPVITRAPFGYEFRPVPTFVKNADPDHQYDEAVIVYDRSGRIDDFYYSIHKFKDIIGTDTSVIEFRKRQVILHFLENVRTAYNRKDIKLIEKMYSDNALIITGVVVKEKQSDMNPNSFNQGKIILKQKDKTEYIEKLKKTFAENSFINIKFDNITVSKSDGKDDIYGINLDQKWNSSGYSDTGSLFLMIDFSNKNKSVSDDKESPVIHVRVWQPQKDSNGRTLTKEEKFSLADLGHF